MSQSSRRKGNANGNAVRSSPDQSEKNRGDGNMESKSSAESHRFKQWISDVTGVLDRPTIALTVFAIGVAFIILASKEVKWFFDTMEYLGLTFQVPYSFLYNFMAAFVFIFVWLDVVVFNKLAKLLIYFASSAWSYILKIRASMKEVENQEQSNPSDKNRKKRT